MVYIRNSINYKHRFDLDREDLEIITAEIFKPKAESFLINSWYRPPPTALELTDKYEVCVRKMDSENKEVILIRDFNCNWTIIIIIYLLKQETDYS